MDRGDGQVPRGERRLAPLAVLTARTICGRFVAGLGEAVGAEGAVASSINGRPDDTRRCWVDRAVC